MPRFNPATVRINELREIVEAVKAYGIKPDPKVAHGIDIHDAIHHRTATAPTVRILDLTEDEAVDHAFNIARTIAQGNRGEGTTAVGIASTHVQDRLVSETWEVLTADIPRIINELRPTFDTAAAQLTAAIAAGITPKSTAQDVLDLEDAAAAAIWNNLDGHIRTLERIKSLRATMSVRLGIAPQNKYGDDLVIDYTSCFAHPDTGITSGVNLTYPNNVNIRRTFGTPFEEWMTLATWTNGNMQLN